MLQTKSDSPSTLAASNWNSQAAGYARLLVLGLVILSLFVADGWFIYRNIVQIKGKSFDFYFIWVGTREVSQGRDPYTPEIARQIQLAVTGDTTASTENPYYFAYPAFLAFLVWPFVSFPFPESVTGWVVAQQICLFLALLLALRSLRWRPSALGLIGLVAAWVAFRYTWIALILGQTTFLALFFISAACYASMRHHERLAGILFALAIIKPQLVLLTILGWLVKRIGERQWQSIGTYATGVVVLTLLPMGLVGNWIPSFLRGLSLYPIYRPSVTPLSLAASTMGAYSPIIQSAGAALCVGYLLWVASKTRNMIAIASLGVLSTLLLIPLPSVYDISLALLPWLACLHVLSARRDVPSKVLVYVLWSLPVISWLVITILPAALDALALPFDVIACDKLIIPVTLFLIFVYTERKRMWLIAC